ncbi:MAG: phospho-N-acetylmuramoyl-pentapeptide-transferase [Bacillota bacterium]|jgi:phospho-N-acetylmuramoyl-pentapeptide-transferase
MKTALLALATAFIVGVIIGPLLIKVLRYLKFGQTIREDGPKRHLQKQGTPTMGGLIFLLAFIVSAVIWADGTAAVVLMVVTTLMFGLIGLIDDGIIIMMHRSLGLTAKQKLVLQFLFAFLFIYFSCHSLGRGTDLIIPFTGYSWDIGIFYYIIMTVFMVYMVNAVNLTDGLDGLAGGITFFVGLGFMIICLLAVNNPPVAGIDYTGLATAVAALIGGILAFLVFNKYPAKVFMGDTGSLALGGAVMALAILTKTEIVFILMGLVYLVEALSVVIQVASFKLTGRRVFKMSPIHHHFEMCGWSEIKIVTVFWTVTVICVILSLLITTL